MDTKYTRVAKGEVERGKVREGARGKGRGKRRGEREGKGVGKGEKEEREKRENGYDGFRRGVISPNY